MNRIWFFIIGLAAGGAAGLLFAPQSGRATRATIKDKSVKYSKDVSGYTSGKARHLANKAKGYAHEVKEVLTRGKGGEVEVKTYI
ncbi:MAG: YtxH domain-containing protein [Armatimonadota bacterium]|nr:YtxH domain-containing protein [Armatimonadota bacterium]